MRKRKPNPRIIELDELITQVTAVLRRMEPDDEEFTTATDNWVKLCAERNALLSNRFSKDQILLVSGNILVALTVIGYERGHVITTNVFKMIGKGTK